MKKPTIYTLVIMLAERIGNHLAIVCFAKHEEMVITCNYLAGSFITPFHFGERNISPLLFSENFEAFIF